MPNTAKAGTRYVVVTRKAKVPVSVHATIEAAGDKIVRERALAIWTVLAQEGLTASAPYRELTNQEKRRLERKMFPTLFE